MDTSTWRSARALFEQLCDLPAERIASALEGANESAEVIAYTRKLLNAERSGRLEGVSGTLSNTPAASLVDVLSEDSMKGERIGPYRIEQLIGTGGMGAVFRAIRVDGEYEGSVAIKFMGDGGTEARFQTEKQALGRLVHPGIARIVDSGQHSSLGPFLVMEYVQGLPIDEYCRRHQPGFKACVRLVAEVIDAVGYAHGQLVLHRDLKPSNILVTDQGRPVILDFGIAKFLRDTVISPNHTELRGFTPRYAAPEQLAGEPLGIPADLFSLGVVLYELLSGAHPFIGDAQSDVDLGALMVRVLQGQSIPLRRALARKSAGSAQQRIDLGTSALKDLEAVLEHVLARNPSDSFQSASAFADELRRVLEDRPVRVCRPTPLTLAYRLARRQWQATSGLAAAVLSLVVGAGVAYSYALESAKQRDAALASANQAQHLSQILIDAFGAANPLRSKGEMPSAKDVLDSSSKRLAADQKVLDNPRLAASLESALADTYRSLGLLDDAEALYRRGLSRVNVSEHPDAVAELTQGMGWLSAYQGRWKESEQLLRQAAELLASSRDYRTLGKIYCRLAVPLLNQQRAEDARFEAQRGLAILREASLSLDLNAITCASSIASSYVFEDRLADAESQYLEVIALIGRESSLVNALGGVYGNLGAVRLRLGRFQEAAISYRIAIDQLSATVGAESQEVAGARLGLAMAFRGTGEFASAETEFSAATNGYLQWFGADHHLTAYAQTLEAEFLYLMGREQAAREHLGQAPKVLVDTLGESAANTCRSRAVGYGIALALDTPPPPRAELESTVACLSAEGASPLAKALALLVSAREALASGRDDAAGTVTFAVAAMKSLPVEDPLLQRQVEALGGSDAS